MTTRIGRYALKTFTVAMVVRLLAVAMFVAALVPLGVVQAQDPGPNDPPIWEPVPPVEPEPAIPYGSGEAEPAVTTMSAPVVGVEPKTVSSDLLLPGESVIVDKTVTTPPIPPKPDIYFLADTTGSMGSAIANVRSNAAAILLQVAAQTADPQFGAGSYRDFPYDPYAFRNDAAIDDQDPALAAINAWSALGGADGSEAQLFALDRIAEGAPGWRSSSTKILVWFGDWPGHDPVCSAISGLGYDITETSVVEKLVAAGIRVIAISVSTDYSWFHPGCTLCDLDGDPALSAWDYTFYCDTPGGTAGQAGRIAEATGGCISRVQPLTRSLTRFWRDSRTSPPP